MKIYSGGPLEIPPVNLAQMFRQTVQKHGSAVGMRTRPSKGEPYKAYTWAEFGGMVREVGNGLMAEGVKRGDRIAIVSETRFEWALADFGILSAGGVTVTVYPTLTPDQMAYLFNDSGATVVFLENQAMLDKVAAVVDQARTVRRYVTMTECAVPASLAKLTITLDGLREAGRAHMASHPQALDERTDMSKPDDVATLVYTSGTTGTPKGAILTHKNFVSALYAARKALNLHEPGSELCFLPLAHCYGRLGLFLVMELGGDISFSSPATLIPDMQDRRPELITSVPRLYERMYAQIVKKVDAGPEGKRKIFYKAADVARQYGRATSNAGEAPFVLRLQHAIFDRLVYSKLREALGMTELKIGLTGAAAIRPDLLYFFQGIGINLIEGYGLTETSAPSNVNLPHKFKPGSVGPPFPGMEMMLADDGEILMKGPNVFKGYYRLDGETKEAFTEDGWFRTGDIGRFDEDGYLYIVDRKKELEVLNTGKKIAPVTVEEKLKLSPMVAEASLMATDRKFAGCLVQPNFDALVDWAKRNGVPFDASKVIVKPDPTGQPMTYGVGRDLLDHGKVQELYQREIDACNAKCADFEQIKVWRLVDYAFTMDRDELTPTLKKKRRIITKNYAPLIADMFGE